MIQEQPKVSVVILQLPADLALEVFRESGTLPIDDFPATLRLADRIAEALKLKNEDSKFKKQTLSFKKERPVSAQFKRKPNLRPR
jgi:hypothetical protein